MTAQVFKPPPIRGLQCTACCPRCPAGKGVLGYVAGGKVTGDQSRALLRCLFCGRHFQAAIVLYSLDEIRLTKGAT